MQRLIDVMRCNHATRDVNRLNGLAVIHRKTGFLDRVRRMWRSEIEMKVKWALAVAGFGQVVKRLSGAGVIGELIAPALDSIAIVKMMIVQVERRARAWPRRRRVIRGKRHFVIMPGKRVIVADAPPHFVGLEQCFPGMVDTKDCRLVSVVLAQKL